MAVLFTPKRRNVKPPVGALVQYGHPMAQGLVEAVLFNEGAGTPHSLMRLVNATQSGSGNGWTNQTRTYNGSGIDLFANIAAYQLVGALSVSFGFISGLATSDSTFRALVNKRSTSANVNCEFGFNIRNSAVSKQFFWNPGSGYQVVNYTGGSAAPQNQPEHWVGTRPIAATSGKLYINGVLGQSTTGLTAPATSTTPINFGANGDLATEQWVGGFLYFYLWNRELGAAEVQQLYADPYCFIQPQSPLVRYWSVPAGSVSIAALQASYRRRRI